VLVFVSHSRENVGAALKLCDALNHRGVNVWLDRRGDAAVNWSEKVAEAIKGADAFVFLIGPSRPNDPGQRYEWQQIAEGEYYLDPSKALIPIVIGDAEMPGFLKAHKSILVDSSNIDFEAIAGRIAKAIYDPADTVDQEKLKRGREARDQALRTLREYSQSLGEEDVKRASLRPGHWPDGFIGYNDWTSEIQGR
jgi:hypothetical protein